MTNYQIAFEYDLKLVKAKSIAGVAVFSIETEFIPVETYQIAVGTDFGTINGKPVGEKNLIKIFDLFENVPLLSQGVFNIDMNDFVIEAGNFIPEPTVSASVNLATTDYVLYYLVKKR